MYASPKHAQQEKQYPTRDHHLHISRMQDNTAHAYGSNAERKQSGSPGHPRTLIREETGNPVVQQKPDCAYAKHLILRTHYA